ncbi:hypothetical protein [Chakrabartyella piscis]|uniref:hypothetical protein n=1 Tax=Chakrabartyella piscis TaxID=2918914 RepID=UPI0029584080|nr:hypothetical protein [Chakrabartyella piscis]
MKLDIAISNPETKQRLDIDLPAKYGVIEDALLRLNCDETISANGRILDGYERGIVAFYFEKCNIFELNYLASMIENFEYDESSQFIGGYFIMDQKEPMDVHKAINLAMNIQSNNLVVSQPAMDEYDLAKFYLENDLIPEIAGINDEVYDWIVDHADLQSLGEEICQKENGTFISSDYVTMEELENLYEGDMRMPENENYIFQLEVGLQTEPKNDKRYTIQLPTSNAEFRQMMKDFAVTDVAGLRCYQFASIVPQLQNMDFGMEDIETLNELAASIYCFKELNELNTYKAMVDATETVNLETAHQLCECVGEFTLLQKERSYADYGRSRFQNVLQEELLECLDTEDYGRKIAEKNGVSMTSYGVLIPRDGVPLMEKLTQPKVMQSQGMKMEQSM